MFSVLLYTIAIRISKTFSDKILFVSPMLSKSCSMQFQIPEDKIGVWPSSVDTSCFYERPPHKIDRLREDLGLSGRLGVLYHGSLEKTRGLMETVEAFRILKEQHVKATLVLLGDGPLRGEILRFIDENKLKDVVKVPKPVNTIAEVADYIAAADVEIVPLPDHPWWRYQCPIKVLECLASNRPLIVTDIPANRWIIGDNPVAVYLKGTGPRQIADGVKAFLQDARRLDPRLGSQIASRFSVEEIAAAIEHHIRSIVGCRPSADIRYGTESHWNTLFSAR
jgi:glycosyltransferase involved in cell wall biosynthesis